MRDDISIIIPTLNEADHLPQLLADIKAQTLQPREIIVVDGGSTDATVNLGKNDGANVIAGLKGVAPQRTHGGRQAKGQLLVFLDADVRLSPEFLQLTTAEMQRRHLGVACPRYVADSDSLIQTGFYQLLNTLFWAAQKIRPCGGGNCICVTKSLFTRVGGFDAHLTFEDLGFIRAAARVGRFGTVRPAIKVSTRRFKREGSARLLVKYLVLGTLTFFGPTSLANRASYRFDHYDKK